MRHQFTQAESRAGGRKSAEKLTNEQRSAGGKTRAGQDTFPGHNKSIAPSGYWAWSVKYMRGRTGLKLAMPFQIQYLRPEQLRGPDGKAINKQEQRLLFGVYVWAYVWEGLPWPVLPDDNLFLEEVERVHAVLAHDLPLAHPLDALYSQPGDFCDMQGSPWPPRRQHKMFCSALEKARTYALRLWPLLNTSSEETLALPKSLKVVRQSSKTSAPRKLGQRRPIDNARPQFAHSVPIRTYRYGRPDLPMYDRENLLPTRPYRAADAALIAAPWKANTSTQAEGSPL